MKDNIFNIIVAGVGGQGNLVSSRVIAEAAVTKGLTPTVGQTFGASRRGGTVFTHIRLWKRQVAPIIPQGHVNVVLGMEPLESLRALHDFAGLDTIALVVNNPIATLDTLAGRCNYPDFVDLLKFHIHLCKEVYQVYEIPKGIERRYLNAFMLGVMSSAIHTPLSTDALIYGINSLDRETASNLDAFRHGTEYGEKLRPVQLQ